MGLDPVLVEQAPAISAQSGPPKSCVCSFTQQTFAEHLLINMHQAPGCVKVDSLTDFSRVFLRAQFSYQLNYENLGRLHRVVVSTSA